jgi:hypothetical protein
MRSDVPTQAYKRIEAASSRAVHAQATSSMFKIDGTDFGINPKKSKVKTRVLKDGSAVIDAEVYGDPKRYEKITENDDSPWSWTLYPPHFYLRSFPAKLAKVTAKKATKVTARITVSDLDEHEAAIYLIEHNDVDNVSVLADGTTFSAKGTVFLAGRPKPFSIKFETPRKA